MLVSRLMNRFCRLAISYIVPVLVLAAPSIAFANWDAVVADAKKEGKVVVYIAGATDALPDTLKKFQAETGIQVDFLRSTPAELRERIRTEFTTNRVRGDLVMTGNTIKNIAEVFQPHGEIPNIKRIVAPFQDDGTFVPYSVGVNGIFVNTKLVKESEMPKRWQDLLDPKWKGKMLAYDPRVGGPGNGTFTILYDMYGREYLEKFAAQKPEFLVNTTLGQRRVAQGEFPIYVGGHVGNIVQLPGLPIKAIAMEDGSPYVTTVAMIMKGAANPNAARVLLNYILAPEAQKVLVTQVSPSPTGDVADNVPADLKYLIGMKLRGEPSPVPAKMDEMFALMKDVFR